jgi:hypothetical protein
MQSLEEEMYTFQFKNNFEKVFLCRKMDEYLSHCQDQLQGRHLCTQADEFSLNTDKQGKYKKLVSA